MERTQLLSHLKQPQRLVDICAGAVCVLGLFGCFHDSPMVKDLSLSALMAGVGTLGANSVIAGLYAETAANVLDRELHRSRLDQETATNQVTSLSHQLDQQQEQWDAHRQTQDQQITALTHQLQQRQTALAEAQTSLTKTHQQSSAIQSNYAQLQSRIIALTQERDRAQQQFQTALATLTQTAQKTLSEAVSHWQNSLTSTITTTAHKRPELAPRLAKLIQDVTNTAEDYQQQISALATAPASESPSNLVDQLLSLLHHAATQFSALKVQYRNAINIADTARFQAEIATLKQQFTDVVPRSHHEAILTEFQIKKDEVFQTLIEQAKALETDLNGDTDAYVQDLIRQLETATREIASLRGQVDDLRQPHNFSPATRDDLRIGNQIIEYFRLHGITLDRAGSDYHKHHATLQFHTDRNARLILPADLNEHADKLPQITRALNQPEFKYDSESGLMSVWVQLSQKPPIDTGSVLKSVGTAQDFLKYLSANPISYRIIADKGRGKTPLMAVMVSHFLKTGGRKGNVPNGVKMPNVLVGVSYPNADFSQKDKGRYPLEPFLFARNDEQCKKAIGQIYHDYQLRRDPTKSEFVDHFFQLWVIDEADNTLDFSADGSASKMRSIFNDGGHGNIGWIFAGQSVNTRVLKGWTNDDRKKSTEIIIEAAKIRAWAEAYGSDYYSDDRLKSLLANVDAVGEAIEKENAAICDEAKRLRIALVADAISPKLFLLPSFDSAEFDLDAYLDVRKEADGILASSLHPHASTRTLEGSNPDSSVASQMPSVPYVGVGCPKCKNGTLSRTKKNRGSILYLCNTCGRSTAERVLSAQFSTDSNH